MDFTKGMVVISRAGRDNGYPMVVVDVKDGFVFVCDGKERPLERPKKKNPLHLGQQRKRYSSTISQTGNYERF